MTSVLQNTDIVKKAKERLVITKPEMPIGYHWDVLNASAIKNINNMVTVQDVIKYIQTPSTVKNVCDSGFDHRILASSFIKNVENYYNCMCYEFPMFSSKILSMCDSPYALPETLVDLNGKKVSNIYFWSMMSLLQCYTYIKDIETVCEIGGGYGGMARLWLNNTIAPVKCYIDVDFAESLFFAEVYLKANIPELKILHITTSDKLTQDVLSQYSVILCPLAFVDVLSNLHIDLAINTGSMQEMTDDWIDFWMYWLKKQDCRWFYSLNYFASPLFGMEETRSTWSPRLSPEWTIRLQKYNPPFIKVHGIFNRSFAEILAQKLPSNMCNYESQYTFLKEKILDGQVLLETMDIIHSYPDENIMFDLLQRVVDMPVVPKEALYLAKYLNKTVSSSSLNKILNTLYFIRGSN